jgi:hypothetical protein
MDWTLKRNRLYYANNRGKQRYHASDFNCWGATAFVLGMMDNLVWLGDDMMIDILTKRTFIINNEDRQRGDILVIYEDDDYLTHTAVYLGHKKFFHKRGRNTSEITDMGGIVRIYGNDKIEYRRVAA